MLFKKFSWIFLSLLIVACNSSSSNTSGNGNGNVVPKANITEVTAQANQGAYTFYVTVASDETGCDQYADWWEVLGAKGDLIYRRILFHSHPTDQPFTRSGSPVHINANDIVYIRAHMNKAGYTGDVFKGSIASGFLKTNTAPSFAKSIETQTPLPDGCAF